MARVQCTVTFLIFSSPGTRPTTLAGGVEGPGNVQVAWGRKVRSIQPLRMAGCFGKRWGGGEKEEGYNHF